MAVVQEQSWRTAFRQLGTSVFTIVSLSYLGILALTYFMQDSLLFLPSASNANVARHHSEQAVTFQRENAVLHGWIIPASTPDAPAIAYYGGNAEEMSRSLGRLQALGNYRLILINYRGYGKSTGLPGEEVLKSDAVFVLERLIELGEIEAHNTYAMGRSLGTGVAIHVAARFHLKGVILMSPYTSIADVAAHHYPYLPVRPLINNPFETVEDLEMITAPALIFRAEQDDVIPPVYSDQVARDWPAQVDYHVLADTNHNAMMTVEFYEKATGFLERDAAKAGTTPPTGEQM